MRTYEWLGKLGKSCFEVSFQTPYEAAGRFSSALGFTDLSSRFDVGALVERPCVEAREFSKLDSERSTFLTF